MKPRILFLVPYPPKHAPSQRFRVELYERFLQDEHISYTIAPFMDERTWEILYKGGGKFQKLKGIIRGYWKRWKTIVLDAPQFDYIFIHREAAPLGPPVYEWILAKLLRKKIIYDFDDAIWIPNTTAENKIAAWFKAFWKVAPICRWSYKVVGGNAYLCSYARQFNENVLLLPTCVDIANWHNRVKRHQETPVVIGWTGSHSTLFYLDEIIPVIEELRRDFSFTFMVIANKDPQLPLANYEFVPWQEATEIEDLLRFDIGVMPLTADQWSAGKCGFKLIQYLALGIPSVASPVGVNVDIIQTGVNGFLAADHAHWKTALAALLRDVRLRENIGGAGRATIVENYSVQAHKDRFLALFS